MAKKRKKIWKVSIREVVMFKLANRRGYAAIARNHLTEGRSVPQAYERLVKACRRSRIELPAGRLPKPRKRV